MPTAQEIKSDLEKSGLFVSEKTILEYVEELGPKVGAIQDNILDTDFKDIGEKILPKDISKAKESQSVALPLVLQVVSVRNISQPESKQWSSTHIDDNSSRRTLLLHLTDGHIVCRALEVSQLSQISVNSTPPGSKIRITGNELKTHQGFLIFDAEIKIEVLGGTVPALIQTWKAKQLAATRKLLGTKNHTDGEGPPMFKPIEVAQPKSASKEKKHDNKRSEANSTDNTQKTAETTPNNNNNNNSQHKQSVDKRQQSQQKRQPKQREQYQVDNQTQSAHSNTQTQPSNSNPQSREPKHKEHKYREVKKPAQADPPKELPKEAPQVEKTPTQQHYVPKHRAQNQNSNSNDRKKYSEKEPKTAPKQQQPQVYKQKQSTIQQQPAQLSYLPQITQFPMTFSATCRVLQVFLANAGPDRFFLQFSLQDASNQMFPAIVDNPELLEHIISLSIADLIKHCSTTEGQTFVQKRTEQAFQSLLNHAVTFAFAIIYPGIPFSILSVQ